MRYSFAPRFAVSCADTLLREGAELIWWYDVRHMFIAGQQVIRDGALLTDDKTRIIRQANHALRRMTNALR